MKWLISFLIATLLPLSALANTSTVNPNVPAANSPLSSAAVRGNFSAAYNDINAIWTAIADLSGGFPGGSTGQVQYNAGSGNFGGFTFSGDCTLVYSTGVITCTKSNGTAFAAAAFEALGGAIIDDGAGNLTIGSGDVTNAMLQHSSMTLAGHSVSLGGAQTLACGDLSDSGTACAATAPADTPATTHKFFTTYTASTGAFIEAQAAFSDISGQATNAQLATQTANTVLGALTATTPSGLSVPSCSASGDALKWTSGTGFGCATGFLTGNQSITLSGDASGSGTTAITVDVTQLHSNTITNGDWCTSNGTIINCNTASPVVSWPTSGNVLISTGTNSPSSVAEVDGDCLIGATGSWTTGSCGGGGGTPGGSDTQVQWNNAGSFDGITGATTDGTKLTLVAPILGTPTSGTLTHATGLPLSTGVTGKLPLANGGTNADLSATGGTSEVLKQVSSGAAVTVAQLACADLSDSGTGCSGAASATGANPSGTAGPAAVNGSAATFMRSDGAPAVQKASAAQFGIVETDGSTITPTAGVIACTTGTSSQLGCLRPDGTNITVSAGAINTAQAIGTSATPTFASETLSAATNQLVLGTTRTLTLTSPEPATSSRTLTLPDPGGADSVAYLALAQTLTNKSIAGSEINSSTVGNTYGGTGQNSSSSTGVAQVSSGTWSFSTALANGTTATKQSAGSNDTKVATDSYVDGVATLGSLTSASSLATVGTIGTGIWHGTALTSTYLPADTAYLDAYQAWTAGQAVTATTPAISTSTFTPDLSASNNANITLVHASCPCTIANPSAVKAGESGVIAIIQSATGSDTVTTWGNEYIFTNTTAPVLSTAASAVDYLSYYAIDTTHLRVNFIPATPQYVSAGGFISNQTKFTTSGCSVSSTTGGATAGKYTSGTTGTCTVTVTMNGATGLTAPNGWSCWANDETTPADKQQTSSSSTTTAVITGTTVSGDVVDFGCMGF